MVIKTSVSPVMCCYVSLLHYFVNVENFDNIHNKLLLAVYKTFSQES